jgi:hypothetical protein
MKKQTLEKSCEGFLENSRICAITGYNCKEKSKDDCDHYQFIAYRLRMQKYKLNGLGQSRD